MNFLDLDFTEIIFLRIFEWNFQIQKYIFMGFLEQRIFWKILKIFFVMKFSIFFLTLFYFFSESSDFSDFSKKFHLEKIFEEVFHNRPISEKIEKVKKKKLFFWKFQNFDFIKLIWFLLSWLDFQNHKYLF